MQVQLSLLLDRSRADSLTNQLITQIRDAIRFGRIPPGVRLPSSRRLSEQLGVGRNTVTRAYEALLMECYVESRPASGMFAVPPPLPAASVDGHGAAGTRARPAARGGAAPARAVAVQMPTQTAAPQAAAPAARNRSHISIDFAPGRTNAGLFPLKTWRRVVQSCLSQGGALGLSQPVDPFGLASLRAAIANHLAAARGLVADPGRIIVVGGIEEAIALAARLFVRPGAGVAMETPGPMMAASAFRAAGAELIGVAVDESGLIPADLPDQATAVLYVTPSHQLPTGHTMSAQRREEIVAWARRHGCVIIEDDAGCDFRYEGGAPHAIAAAAPDCTLYVGSFAESLGAGFGIGYVVVPPSVAEHARAAKTLLSGGLPWLDQAALAELLRGGSYISHLTRMRIAYRERRDQLLLSLRRHFGDVEVSGTEGGLHVFWNLPPGVPDAPTIAALGRRARVGISPLDECGVLDAFTGTLPGMFARRCLMLGYAALSPKQIEQGIARLSDAVDDALDLHRIGLGDLLTHRPAASRPVALPLARRSGKPALRFRQQPALPSRASPLAPSRNDAARGSTQEMPVVSSLYRYPVKGLSAQPVETAQLRAGKPFPFDRVMAFARPGVSVNPDSPTWAKKGLFVMLMLDEGLATVQTRVDEGTLELTVSDGRHTLLSADLADPEGRARVEAFFHRLAPTLPAPPRLVRATAGGHFMDKPDNVISLINLATLRRLEQQWGVPLDPLRFRANIYIDGAAPWEEFDWVGTDIRLGAAMFHVDRRNGRCGATNVDPATGRRDLDIPRSLRTMFGHKDLGIYLVARNDAALSVGDALDLPESVARTVAVAPEPMAAAVSRAFMCRGCYYIYDEGRGLPDAGIAAGSRFIDLPTTWRCPDCGTDKTLFRLHAAA